MDPRVQTVIALIGNDLEHELPLSELARVVNLSPSHLQRLFKAELGMTTFRYAAWCHGAVGIGLAHLDLDPTLTHTSTRKFVRRAAAATWRLGMGWNHCACHGDLGAWELLNHAIAAGEAPKELSASHLLDVILTSLEQHGPSFGLGRNAFTPGLLPGLGGVAYQLLRAHPEHDLPSILTPGGEDL